MADRSRVSLQYIKSTTAKHTTWVFGLGSACQECLCHCGFMNAPLPTGVLACEVGKLPQCLVWPSPKPLPLQLFKRWQSQTVTPTGPGLPPPGRPRWRSCPAAPGPGPHWPAVGLGAGGGWGAQDLGKHSAMQCKL